MTGSLDLFKNAVAAQWFWRGASKFDKLNEAQHTHLHREKHILNATPKAESIALFYQNGNSDKNRRLLLESLPINKMFINNIDLMY